MRQKKLEVTQTGNIAAEIKKWENIVKKGPDIMHNEDLITYGGAVFAFAHLVETKHTVAMNYFSAEHSDSMKVREIADRLRERHACIFSVSSLNGSFAFDIYFVFDEKQKKIENIICADIEVGIVYFLTDGEMLPAVLRKFMQLDDMQNNLQHDFSLN